MASKTIILLFFFIFLSLELHTSFAQTRIKAGYWYTGSESPIPDIDSSLFTHLTCAFANVNSSTYQLSISSSDEQYFSGFTAIVKRRNPSVLTLLSIWDGQDATYKSIVGEKLNYSVLSAMVSQASYRKSFIESSMKAARLYGFHGIDLFWLYPNTDSDMINLGILLDEWRAAVNSETRKSNQSQLSLTMALHYLPAWGSISYPVDSIQRNMDWAHVMAYDYHLPTKENFTGAHAALYDPSNNVSTNFGIERWTGKGLHASKLVLGLPYHGYAWTLKNPKDNGVGAPALGVAVSEDGSMSYKYIKWYIKSYGATVVFNSTYVVNYCTIGLNWIGFDGVEAVRAKISYAKERGLLGYNVFLITNDDNSELSRTAAQEGDKGHQNNRRLLLIILLPTACVIILISFIVCCLSSRVFKSKGMNITSKLMLSKFGSGTSAAGNLNTEAPTLQVFSFASIKEATKNFSSENRLGEGGFGPVYKGKLAEGQEIAVKRLSKTSTQGLEEFRNEVSLTARLQHVNLLRVLGFCSEGEEKMLIYENMANRSLDFYLYDPIRRHFLDWRKRVNIIEGVTQGLLYLQEYSNFTIIHRDLKASNILLDDDMNPKISDFGMARLFRKDVHEANTSRIIGTYGYVPPEYVRKGIYSMKYDVYSFGVLLLQIISSKRITCYYGLHENLNLLEHAYELWKDGEGMEFIDPSLDDSDSPCKLMRCMQVALLCVQENPVDRPTMLEISTMLKNDSAASVETPKRPAFSVIIGEDVENGLTSQEAICSNDATITQVIPR